MRGTFGAKLFMFSPEVIHVYEEGRSGFDSKMTLQGKTFFS